MSGRARSARKPAATKPSAQTADDPGKPFDLVARQARRLPTVNQYNWSAALNFTYVPAYGKFAGFGDFIFHYDAYVVGGVGAAIGAIILETGRDQPLGGPSA